MKMHHVIVLLVVLLLAGAALAADHGTRQISVHGTATVEAVPDQMRWRVSVRNVDAESARNAADAQNRSVSEVIAFLKRNGVEEREIQTSRLRLGEHWNHEGPQRVRAGYAATTDLVFTLADLTRHTDIWLGLADIAAVSISNVDLDHSERIRLQDEARDQAVLAARAKAAHLAARRAARPGDGDRGGPRGQRDRAVRGARLDERLPFRRRAGPGRRCVFSGNDPGARADEGRVQVGRQVVITSGQG